MFQDQVSLKNAGFQGFVSVGDLRRTRLAVVPDKPGVYLILLNSQQMPSFLDKSPGGHFKARDPSVSVEKLRQNWVGGTPVLYIGKAGMLDEGATLRKRLNSYFEFGCGRPVGHWGGRYIWQLKDSEKFFVCWKETPQELPRSVESSLIAKFKLEYAGRRPFANLQD